MPHMANYPPGVTGMEPQIVGELETDTDPLYLVCRECGEAFKADESNAIETAFEHQQSEGVFDGGFDIRPESEAM